MSWLVLVQALARAGSSDPFVEYDTLSSTYGLSVGDVDGDDWTDMVAPQSHLIWLNDEAKGWTSTGLPELADWYTQYGVSLGDYDADGLNDISTEPRGYYAILLHNDGGTDFSTLDVDQFPEASGTQNAETNGWVDADGDGLLDLFIPAYYGDSGFYQNLGPDSSGDYFFDEVAHDIGIDLSKTSQLRPEGAQFCDVDRDGDPDLYVCAELLRNESNPGDLLFETDNGGIETGFDEGAAFADIDMDGDFDLGVMYQGIPMDWRGSLPREAFLLWENLGDGTFVLLPADTTEDYDITETYNLGMSFADWDMDGDPDLTFSDRFEVNHWRESAERSFEKITTDAGQTCATPGWFDWDFDGDLDIGLGVWGGTAQFFTNPLFDAVPEKERGFIRVRPVTDSKTISEGTDTEFGATVDVHVHGDAPEVRRRNFVASGHGYLNQSEYPLTFGFADMKAPIVDVSVDFANPSDDGLRRVDRYVNPVLGDIDVTALAMPREVRVFRSGDVEIAGVSYPASTDESPLLETPGGLPAPSIDDELVAVDPGTWVGVDVTIPKDADPTRGAAIRELLVEGTLDAPVTCDATSGNVLVWDVTGEPTLVAGATGPMLPDNRRADVPTDFELHNGHTYRVMALVTATRAFAPEKSSSWLAVGGGIQLLPASPCDPTEIGGAVVGGTDRSLSVRWRERVVEPEEPEDTGDTGDTADTGTGDTGTAKDDSGTPKDTGEPPIDQGRNDDYGNQPTDSGCGCASGSGAGSLGFFALLAAPLILRRRSDR